MNASGQIVQSNDVKVPSRAQKRKTAPSIERPKPGLRRQTAMAEKALCKTNGHAVEPPTERRPDKTIRSEQASPFTARQVDGFGFGLERHDRVFHLVAFDTNRQRVTLPALKHPAKSSQFKCVSPNKTWQTGIFSFELKRQDQRLYLVAFMDTHSRFIVGWGLFSCSYTAMVVETLKTAVASFQAPAEILTDHQQPYVPWHGQCKFAAACFRMGIQQNVVNFGCSQPLGKIERFWGTLWNGSLSLATLEDAASVRTRLGAFMDYYHFERPHRGLNGLTPADAYFGQAARVKEALRRRLAKDAAHLVAEERRVTRIFEQAEKMKRALQQRMAKEAARLEAEERRVTRSAELAASRTTKGDHL